MTGFAVQQPLQLKPLHTVKTYWSLVAALVIAGLLTSAFVIGRVTASPADRTITTVRPIVVQPASAQQGAECHVHQPC